MVRQKTGYKQAKIMETEQGRIWFTYFDILENPDPGKPDPLKIEALSSSGVIVWKDGIYEDNFSGEADE
ncbi:hypothetical protein JNE38_15930 [Brevibacillus choshinensis]|uniref:Uncharacterized protein n=2 Tax=Brevibacillus choshinensis TaxID=54911 RepID=A0ABX7FHD1_BRECH|nr:hypothetical protein JNE38_15930 [Brevibacillus choshinensis]